MSFLIISRSLTITGTVVYLRCHIFTISISRSLYLLNLLNLQTDMFLSVRIDIPIRRHIFLLQSLTTISSLFLRIFLSFWIENFLRIVDPLYVVISFGWYLFQFLMVGWLVGFDGISTFVGYLALNPFLMNNQFYFKQFSLAWVQSLIVKNISISSYSV